MELYHWSSGLMAGFTPGVIVVQARNADHARGLARAAFSGRWPDAAEADVQAFEADIAKEPTVEPVGLFIRGGV